MIYYKLLRGGNIEFGVCVCMGDKKFLAGGWLIMLVCWPTGLNCIPHSKGLSCAISKLIMLHL